jgi:NADPH2:quinone reductase
MRALLCKELGPPERLTIEDIDPPQPGPGEVVVDVRAAGINFPDTLIIRGRYQFKPELPFVPGGEAAGTVAALGDGVDRYRVGDRVIALAPYGAFAERMTVPAALTLPLPASIDFEAGAGIGTTFGTSYYALKQQARLQAGETLLVLGAAGGVGVAAVELGKALGARVIAAASTGEKLIFAAEAGADLGINYTSEPLKERVKELTDGRGADVVYDPVGGDYSEQALRATAWGGRFLVVGFAAGQIPNIPLNLALLKGAHIIGVFWGAWAQREPAASAANFGELLAMFQDGRLAPRVTEVYPLDDFAAAFRSLSERRARGKVILRIA